MEKNNSLEELHKQSLAKVEEYVKNNPKFKEEHHERLNEAKTKWQSSWNEFMDVLVYLETLEI